MSEVCNLPLILRHTDGTEMAAFGDNHSLADIARWIMQNRSEAEDLHMILGHMLDGTYGETLQ
jgi:hypothetical protein